MASDLGMNIKFKKDWCGYVPKNIDEIEHETDLDYKNAAQISSVNGDHSLCRQLWEQPQINWDGQLFGCCVNQDHPLGRYNAFERPLEELMRQKIIRNMKRMICGRSIIFQNRKTVPCPSCSFYKRMVKSNNFMPISTIEDRK